MEILGVRFAPLHVPIKRRLETLAAAAWIGILLFGVPASYFFTVYTLIFTEWLRYVMLIYFVWMYYDWDTYKRGGRAKAWTRRMRNSIWWHYFCSYFPLKLVKTADLDPSRNYLFCSVPHGILSTGSFGAFATDVPGFEKIFPGIEPRIITLDQHFYVPLFREFCHSFGCCSASAESLNYLLKDHNNSTSNANSKDERNRNGRAAILMIGGAAEAELCKPGRYDIVLRRRKGFIKIALRNGSPLVPVISFGETDLYNQIANFENSTMCRIQEKFRKALGTAMVVPVGRGIFQYSFGIIPNRKPVTVVVGSPIDVPKIPEPSVEIVDEYHAKFKEKLIDLFETQKYKYLPHPEGVSLRIK